MNWLAGVTAEVPPGATTVTFTTPVPCGLLTEIWVSESTVGTTLVLPKLTLEAPVNPLPVITTAVPPVVGPSAGVTLVTAGTVGPAT